MDPCNSFQKWLENFCTKQAMCRSTHARRLKAIVRFGVPPAEYCPYDIDRFDEEPDPFLYSFNEETKSSLYFRLDGKNSNGHQWLSRLKAFVAAGFPSILGFSAPSSLTLDGDVPWRPTQDSVLGGQAVVAVGYDDHRIRSTKGAILIRNCWGTEWGENGYGWLPYRYVEQQLVSDLWVLINPKWLDPNELYRPLCLDFPSQSSGQADMLRHRAPLN